MTARLPWAFANIASAADLQSTAATIASGCVMRTDMATLFGLKGWNITAQGNAGNALGLLMDTRWKP
jgi:formylmethanofuran dehydrogenase subunit C